MSTNYKDRLIRIDDIPSDSEIVLEQGNKPLFPLLVLLVCGIVLMFLPDMLIFGIILTLLIMYFMFVMKGRRLFTITKNFIIVYLYHNDKECNIFYLDEIVSWEFKPGKTTLDTIELKLNDGSVHAFETTGPNKLIKTMRQLMASREIKFAKKR